LTKAKDNLTLNQKGVSLQVLFIIYRSMDDGMEEDEYTSDPIVQQRRQVSEAAHCFEEAVFKI